MAKSRPTLVTFIIARKRHVRMFFINQFMFM